MKKPVPRRRAFSLIELLAVAGVIALLAAFAFPAYQSIDGKGKDAQCLGNLRQWGIAVHGYLSDSQGRLPYEGAEENPSWAQLAAAGNQESWYNVLPAYMDHPALRDLTAAQRTSFYTSRKGLIFQCPRASWQGTESRMAGPRFSYAFNSKIFGGDAPATAGGKISVVLLSNDAGTLNRNRRTVAPSTVPMLVDARASLKEPKAMPGMNNDVGTSQAYTRRFSNRHGDRGNIVFFDGSVRSFAAAEIMDSAGRNIDTSSVVWNPWNPDAAD